MWWLLKEQLNIQDFNRVKSRSLHLPHDNMSKDTGCCGKMLYGLFLPEKGACLRLSLWEMDSGDVKMLYRDGQDDNLNGLVICL
jgi:hypothetical protein